MTKEPKNRNSKETTTQFKTQVLNCLLKNKNLGLGILILMLGLTSFIFITSLSFNNKTTENNKVTISKTEKAAIKYIEGEWITSLFDSRALLQAHDGFYQIISFPRVRSRIRKYSRGTITADGGFLILTPKDDMGHPENTSEATYYKLPLPAFAIQAAKRDGNLIWQQGPIQYSLPKKLQETLPPEQLSSIADNYNVENPLFKIAKDGFIIWKPFKM